MDEPKPGDIVTIPFGLGDDVRGRVDHVYGPPALRHVLVWLTPELSDGVVAEDATVSVPLHSLGETAAST